MQICPAFANSVDSDQLAGTVFANNVEPGQLSSSEANWSGPVLVVINYVILYQKPGSSIPNSWKLEVSVAS